MMLIVMKAATAHVATVANSSAEQRALVTSFYTLPKAF